MARIETLVDDINKLLVSPHVINELSLKMFNEDLSKVLNRQFTEKAAKHVLRMSMLGSKCDRQLQYKCDPTIKGEETPPEVRMKFMFGDLVEAFILLLAREAGHRVEGEQDELNINGVLGHRDAVIDGVLVDVKSASSRAFSKFKYGLTYDTDVFGYITQLGSYLDASQHDPIVLDKRRAAFLVVDKQFGYIHLDIHEFAGNVDYKELVHEKQALVHSPIRANRGYFDEPDGKSGNRKLGTGCSYCAFKVQCWPGLRTYNYSDGPRFLTRVEREPKVTEA